jgi:hypothetical protein
MEEVLSAGLLDERDGLNPTRALILQAYYALRRSNTPDRIGSSEIATWIKRCEPTEAMPCESLIRLTLVHAGIAHRAPGRPRNDSRAVVPPFLFPHRALLRRVLGRRSECWFSPRCSRSR